jgi:hypothetical protein
LASAAASKAIAVGVTVGVVMSAIGIYLEEINVLPEFGSFAFGLILGVVPAALAVAILQRQGRLKVRLAPTRSEHLAGRYDYTFVFVAPALGLLVFAVGAFTMSTLILAEDPERYAKQVKIIEQAAAGTLTPERAAQLITSLIEADRAQDEFLEEIKKLLSFMGVMLTAIAAWLLGAGYMALRGQSNRLQPAPSSSGLGHD